MLLCVHRDHYWGLLAPPPSLFFSFFSFFLLLLLLFLKVSWSVQHCFTSTETIRTVRDGEPRTVTSTFTTHELFFFFFFFLMCDVVYCDAVYNNWMFSHE